MSTANGGTIVALPYEQIPDYPSSYTAGTVLGRLMDGIGYRYRWATEGLTESDLSYRPEQSCRSVKETLDHIRDVVTILEGGLVGKRYEPTDALRFDQLRLETLDKVQHISEQLKEMSAKRFEEIVLRFRWGDRDREFPFWHSINGLMSDTIFHLGQVVNHRRAAGNPIDPTVQAFLGRPWDG